MGFFNKLRKQLRKSIRTGEAPVMPRLSRASRPISEMPLTPRQIARKAEFERNKAIAGPRDFNLPSPDADGYYPGDDRYGGGFTRGPGRPTSNLPRKPGFIENTYKFNPANRKPRGGSSIRDAIRRSEQKKFTGLSGLFRRLQEQIRNQQMPQPMQELRAGEIMPNSPVLDRRPSPPRMPAPPIAVPPGIIPNLNLGMPVMPEERMAPPVMNQMQGPPRMMMAAGRDANMVDFLNSDPQQQIFGIETRIGILENQLQEALANNDRQAYDMIVDQINDADAQRIDIMNSMNPTPTIDDILSDLEKKN